MTALIRSELLKLRTTRTTVATVLGALGFAAFLGVVTAGFAGVDGAAPLGSPEMVDNVVGVSTIPAAVGLLLGVLLAAGEYQHHTVTTTFLAAPRRHRVVAAKAVAAATFASATALAMVVAAAAGALPRTLAEGAEVELTAGNGRTVAGLLLAAAVLAVLGVLLGQLVRSQVAALVVVVLEFTVLEGIADTLAGGGLHRWLPGGAASTLAGGGDAPLWQATLVVCAWAAIAALVAVPAVARRDVE
jgi:hypothetical protein